VTTNELLTIARDQYLFDSGMPQKWSDSYLTFLLGEAEREACRRAGLILDRTTQTAGNIASGVTTSAVTDKLVDSGATFVSAMVGMTVYNGADNTWAVIMALDSGTTLSLSADIMDTGEAYTIGDASKAIARICVKAGTMVYPLSSKIIKIDRCYLESRGRQYPLTQKLEVRSNEEGTPIWYTEGKGVLILFPKPDASINQSTGGDMLNLEVYRLPLVDLTMQVSSAPEIPEEYHFDLLHYVCAMAFMKQDDQTIDPAKSQWHEAQFERKFGPKKSAKIETLLRGMPSNFTLEPRSFGI